MNKSDSIDSMRTRVRGCLLGGAVGDALGAPVEFMRLSEIRARFGPQGITDYAPAYGRNGAITDDTQMLLFTAEGLLRAYARASLRGICSVASVVSHAYLRWLLTQGEHPTRRDLEISTDGWLWPLKALHSRRAPGNTCLSALRAMPHFTDARAPNNSKGAGAIMRVAPIARYGHDGSESSAADVFDLAKQVSWLTHGHPSGYLSAAAFAVVVHALLWRHSLDMGIQRARMLLERSGDSAETLAALDLGAACAATGEAPEPAIRRIGEGWVGEEALGVARYCALVADDFATAVCMAVNHDGDSDTTGSLVGQLMGASLGEKAIPRHWLEAVEHREAIIQIADDLTDYPAWDLEDQEDPLIASVRERYPSW